MGGERGNDYNNRKEMGMVYIQGDCLKICAEVSNDVVKYTMKGKKNVLSDNDGCVGGRETSLLNWTRICPER